MEAYREHLQSTGSFRNDSFDLDHLKSIDQQLEYNGEVYDSVVFCEGAYAVYNPLWNWLPFKVAKGDWIVIETEDELCDTILNNVVNTIPLGNRRYKLSSTFEWETMSWEPSKNAVKELTKAFEERFNVPYKIVEHASGLRPAASDRRPYLGVHPRIPKHFIFNGFGSKGVLLAPFFADQLTKHILKGAPLNQEVDIKRHLRRFQAQHP
jgi:glycine/D-amino acid oxidase-like deaminating enzyme